MDQIIVLLEDPPAILKGSFSSSASLMTELSSLVLPAPLREVGDLYSWSYENNTNKFSKQGFEFFPPYVH